MNKCFIVSIGMSDFNEKERNDCLGEDRLLGLFLTVVAVAMTPGPNNLLLASLGASMGLRRGWVVAWGIFAGFPLMVFLVSLGLGGLLSEWGWFSYGLRGVGLVLLLWIAWKIASAPFLVLTEEGEVEGGVVYGFWSLFFFQWVNPKAWVLSTAFGSVHLTPEGVVWMEALELGFLFFVATLLTGTLWLLLGTSLRRFLVDRLWFRVYGILMSLLLLLSVLPLMWDNFLD